MTLASLRTLTWPCFLTSFILSSKSNCFPNVSRINKWLHQVMAVQSKHPCNKQRDSRLQILLKLKYSLMAAYHPCLWQDSQLGTIFSPVQGDI